MTEMRPAIIKLYEKGIPKSEIARLLDVQEATVRKHIKRLEQVYNCVAFIMKKVRFLKFAKILKKIIF